MGVAGSGPSFKKEMVVDVLGQDLKVVTKTFAQNAEKKKIQKNHPPANEA